MIFVLFYKQHRGQPEIMGRLLTKRIFYCLRNLTKIPVYFKALALIKQHFEQFCSYSTSKSLDLAAIFCVEIHTRFRPTFWMGASQECFEQSIQFVSVFPLK